MKVQVFRGLNILLWSLAALTPSWAQDWSSVITSEKHAFRVVTLLPGLENPWSVAFLPDGRMLVTERAGRLRLVGPDFRLAAQPIEGLPEIVERGQGGLFDVVLHRNMRKTAGSIGLTTRPALAVGARPWPGANCKASA